MHRWIWCVVSLAGISLGGCTLPVDECVEGCKDSCPAGGPNEDRCIYDCYQARCRAPAPRNDE